MRTQHPAVVAIAHEDPVIEAGLRHILSGCDEFRIADAAVMPHVLILDHDAGIAWATQQGSQAVKTNVMIVSPRGQEADVRSALAAGVRGYVVTGCREAEIVDAARAMVAGRRHLCTAATLRIADSLSQPTLTEREHAVLALVCRGMNNKEVARRLDISVGTVKSHMRGVLSKLNAKCRTEALCVALQRGLVKRPESERSGPEKHVLPEAAQARGAPSGESRVALKRAYQEESAA